MITDEKLRAMANQYVDFNFRIKAIKGESPLFYDVARAYERGYRIAERESTSQDTNIEKAFLDTVDYIESCVRVSKKVPDKKILLKIFKEQFI